MKSPMNMAPNKMVSPAKKMDPMYNGKAGVQQEDFKQFSAAKMGSAYKMDKSAFKLKSAPVNMKTPGSVAKLAGVSPMKNKISIEKRKQGFTNYTTDPVTGQASASRPATKEEIKRLKNKK